MAALKHLSDSGKYRDRSGAPRDLQGEYKAYLGKLGDYQKKWEADHPGEDFDLDSGEHTAWRDKNEPDIDEDEITRAEGRVDALQAIERRDNERAQSAFAESLATDAAKAAQDSIQEMMSFADGKPRASLEDLDKDDPVAALVVTPFLERAATVSATITTLLTPGSPAQFTATNPVHAEVARMVQHYEGEIMKLPPENRLDGKGRQYVPAADYVKLTPVERQRAWTFRFAPDEMRALATQSIRDEAKRRYDATKPRLQPVPAAPAAPAPPPAPAAPSPAPRPPTLEPGGTLPATTPAPASPARSFWS